MSQLWNWCAFCGKRIETGEKCYGLPNGESVCTDCCVAENEGAADVAPVVRCKDCKHFNHKRIECENESISTDHEGGAQYSLNFWPDDFCSYGEPKEDTHADDYD